MSFVIEIANNYGHRLVYLRDLLRELVIRDIKVRYKHSAMGFAWSMLNPLLHMLVLYFIFGKVLGSGIPRYASYLMSGLLVYDWFQTSLAQAAHAITGNRELVRRPGFPTAILPVVTVITNWIHFLLALPILLLFLWYEGASLSSAVLILPLLMAVQFAVTVGLAYLAASLNVMFRDTQYLLGVLLRLFFFLTPIFYEASHIPTQMQGLYQLNPMVALVEAYRAVLMEATVPTWTMLLVPCLLALLFLTLGYRVFMKMNGRFVEEL